MLISGLSIVRKTPIDFDAEGNEQSEFTATWTNPTNPDAYSVQITVINPDDSGDTDRQTHEDIIDDWGGPGASRTHRIGPWNTFDGERTTFKFWTVNRAGARLASFVSATLTVNAQAFQQATSFTTGTVDYSAKQGAADIPVTIIAPADPRITGFIIYQTRGGIDQEIGAVQITPSATVTSRVTVELPTNGTTSVVLKATPRRRGGNPAPLSGSTATATVSLNPDSQPAINFGGLVETTLTGAFTLSKAPGSYGDTFVCKWIQDITGGHVPTYNAAQFADASSIPAPDVDSLGITYYTFVTNSSFLWELIAERRKP